MLNPISNLLRRILGKAEIRKATHGNGRTLCYPNGTISMNQNSSIVINEGKFEFNKKWNSNDPFPSLLVLKEDAKLIVKKNFQIYSGAKIYINPNAELVLGSGYINHNLSLSCFHRIEIGEDVAISENVCIRDSDNHDILRNQSDTRGNTTQPIKIGDHVWIGMNAVILKGVQIGTGAVIAANAVVTHDIPPHSLAAGCPARIIETNVLWN